MKDLNIVVDGHAGEPELHSAIKSACRALLTGWEALYDEQMIISFITGGISNALFKVQPVAPADGGGAGAAAALRPVAFRVFGDNTEQFIDRAKELGIMQMVHQHGFGAEVLATFSNGRIEEFLEMRSLEPAEMAAPHYVPAIAATLRRFHGMPAEGDKVGRTPFARIYEWLDIAQKFVFEDPQKQERFASFDFAELRGEVQAVEAAAASLHSPLVFAHNDLLSGNIMVSLPTNGVAAADAAANATAGGSSAADSQQQMTFIDFEYADWAPRGFDLGNHFCEYAGFDCDYSRYPNQQQAALFIRHYLAAGSSSDGAAAAADAQDEAEVARCVVEANVYALSAHQYWGTWSLLQAKWSSIDFDYLSYAQLRWGEYHRRKQEFLAQAAEAAAAAL